MLGRLTVKFKVERTSPLTGLTNSIMIEVTNEELLRWKNGELIQDCFPNLTPDERQFMITGYTPEDRLAIFGDEDA